MWLAKNGVVLVANDTADGGTLISKVTTDPHEARGFVWAVMIRL